MRGSPPGRAPAAFCGCFAERSAASGDPRRSHQAARPAGDALADRRAVPGALSVKRKLALDRFASESSATIWPRMRTFLARLSSFSAFRVNRKPTRTGRPGRASNDLAGRFSTAEPRVRRFPARRTDGADLSRCALLAPHVPVTSGSLKRPHRSVTLPSREAVRVPFASVSAVPDTAGPTVSGDDVGRGGVVAPEDRRG